MIVKKIKKMGKDAFTLVELMAVIVILGVLIVIAYPNVSSYINETRETDYTLHESSMRLAATNMMSDCVAEDDGGCLVGSGKTSIITLGDLIDLQYLENLKDPEDTSQYCDTDKSYVEITNNGTSYADLSYKVCLVCSNYTSADCSDDVNNGSGVCSDDDSNDPVCGDVSGDSTLWTNEDRIISVGCSDDGNCNKSTYYKKFDTTTEKGIIEIEDNCGNRTSCDVNVYVDKEVPKCELEIEGTLGENNWYVDTAVVKIKSMTDEESGIATYGIGTSSKNYDFNKEDSYTVSGGITTVYGYVKDNAGNVGYCSIEVKYDDAKPTQETYYGYLVYDKSDISTTSGKYITLDSDTALSSTGVSESNILSEYGDIYGLYVYPNSSNEGMVVTVYNGTTELKSITIASGVTTPVYVQFDSTFKGNSLKIEVANSKGGSTSRVSYVSKIEVLTQSTTGYYTNQDVTLYIHAKDSLSGKASYSFDGGSTWQSDYYKSYSANTGSLSLYTKDKAGNISSGSSMNINNIDKEEPNCSITLSDNGNTSIVLNYDDSTSGARYYYLTTSSSTTYGKKSTVTQSSSTSEVTWHGYVIDKAGNTSTCSLTTTSNDTTPPTCTNSGDNTTWTNSSITIKWGCSDSESGCDSLYSGGSKTFSSTTKTASISKYTIKDNAGNVTECPARTANVYVDTTKPTCSISLSSASYDGEVYKYTATVTGSDSNSGIKSKKISNGSSSSSSSVSTGNTATSYTFTATCTDNAGNTATTTQDVTLTWNLQNTSTGVYYTNLSDAISAATSGDTIKVLRSYNDSSSVTISKNITLNTNGKTITKKSSGITVKSGKTLTISGSGTLKASGNINLLYVNGTLKLSGDGLKIVGANNVYNVLVLDGSNASLTNTGSNSVSIYGNYSKQYTNTTEGKNTAQTVYVINGATLTIGNSNFKIYSYKNRAVEVNGSGSTLTLNSGMFANGINSSSEKASGARGIVAIRNGATFTMNGGTLYGYANGEYGSGDTGSAGVIIKGTSSYTSYFKMYGGTISLYRIGDDNCIICSQGYSTATVKSTKSEIVLKARGSKNYRFLYNDPDSNYAKITVTDGSGGSVQMTANIVSSNYFFRGGSKSKSSGITINSGVYYCKTGDGGLKTGNVTNNGTKKC